MNIEMLKKFKAGTFSWFCRLSLNFHTVAQASELMKSNLVYSKNIFSQTRCRDFLSFNYDNTPNLHELLLDNKLANKDMPGTNQSN